MASTWNINREYEGIEISFDGKPSEEIRNKMKAVGFRWSSAQMKWYAKDNDRTRKVANELATQGEDIGEHLTFEQKMERDKERAERRQERLGAKVEKLEKKSEDLLDKAHKMAAVIPFGQPILVGHHSEGRDRRYRGRIHDTFGKGFETMDEAKEVSQRLEGSQALSRMRESPGYMSRKIDQLEADLRKFERDKGQWQGHIAEWEKRTNDLKEQITYWKKELGEAGGLKVTPADVKAGDEILYLGTWYEVVRVNPKTVTIKNWLNIPTWTWGAEYSKIREVRHNEKKAHPYVSTGPDKVVSIVERSNVTPKEVGKWEITKTEYVNPEQRWVYGSQDNQWHLVSSNDRDYAHGISQDRMKLIGQEAAKFEYLSPALTKPALLYPAKPEPSRYPDPAISTTPKVFTYYFRNRPPSIGTHPEGAVMKEEWMPMRNTPKGNMAFGWVSYERELSADEIKSYELFVDEIVMPKLVAELVKFTHDEGIQEGYKELKSEYGKALIGWLKANNEWKPDKGEEAEFLRHLARLTGITQPKPKQVPDTSSKDYKSGYNLAIQGRIAPAVPAWTDQGIADFAQGYKDGQVAKTRKENEELLAKDKAARDKILYKEQAEEQELNEELNRLAPQYKSFIEREITGTLHMDKENKNYHDRFVIALGKARRIIVEIQQRSKKEERDCIKFDVKQAIKLVADTVETIRRPDVFRALNQNKEHAIELANFIKSNRMDLIEEVNKCLVEMGLKEQPSYIKEETERVFGKPVQAIPAKPRVMGAPSRQEIVEKEARRRAEEGKRFKGQQVLTSAISTSHRLSEFEEKPIISQRPVKSMAEIQAEADAKEEWEAMEMARAAVGRITEQKIKMQIEREKRAE